jgi:hypothetical protein
MNTFKGSKFPQLQRTRFNYDPSRGYVTHYDYHGMNQQQMLLLQQDIVAAGIACDLTYERDIATLSVEDSTNANPIDVWEMPSSGESRDGLSHPSVLALASNAQIAAMRTHLQNNDTITSAFADTVLLPLAGTIVPTFYDLQQRGSPEYRKGYYSLRHTTNVSNRWQVNIADFGVDEIYTTAALLSEIANNGLWVFPCPGRLQYKIANIPVEVPGTEDAYADQYQWGWLKSISSERTGANNRVDIVTEYQLALWSTAYYQPY